jgi:single-stranded DNA-binding protein
MSKYNLRMPQVNSTTLSGYVTAGIDLKYTKGNKPWVSFRIASDHGFKENKTTSFWSVKAWGKTAERCASELCKGAPVIITGETIIEEWIGKEDQAGADKRLTPTILARSVNCLAWLNEPEPGATEDDVPF